MNILTKLKVGAGPEPGKLSSDEDSHKESNAPALESSTEDAEEESDEPIIIIEDDDDFIAAFGGGETWGPGSLTFFGPQARTIVVAGEIDREIATGTVSQLLQLEENSAEDPIVVYINTPGGEIQQALAIYDAMRMIKAPVITIAFGECYSAGLIILQGGDIRGATESARFMYHEPLTVGAVTSRFEASALSGEYEYAASTYDKILRKRTGISRHKWKKNFKGSTGTFFDAKKARKLGFINSIIRPEQKDMEIDNGK